MPCTSRLPSQSLEALPGDGLHPGRPASSLTVPRPDGLWETTILDPTWDPRPFVGRSGETAHHTGPRKRPRAEASGTLGAERPSSVETGGGGQGGQLRELPFKGAVPPGGWHSASRPWTPSASPWRCRSPGHNTPSGRLTPSTWPQGLAPSGLHSRAPCSHSPGRLSSKAPAVWSRGQGSRTSGVGAGAHIPCSSPWGTTPQAPLHTPDGTPALLTFLRPQSNQVGS